MSAEIWVAIITGLASVVSVIITVWYGNKLMAYRIEQLENKVNKHNNLIERTYILEKRLDVDEEKLKVANNRIHDLEEYHK